MLIAERNAEAAVLGGLLMNPDVFDQVSHLKPSDFSSLKNQRIYRTIYQMIHDGEAVDVLTVHDKIKDDADLAYMTEMVVNTPSVANIETYARVVKEHAQRRELVIVASELNDDLYGDVKEAADKAQAKIEAVMGANEKNEPVLAADDMTDYINELHNRYEGKGSAVYATGFKDLDRMLNGGIRGGDIVMIAARPKAGKAQPVWSKVLLKNGDWKPIGKLRIGDELASIDGEPSVVTGVFPQGKKQVYEMVFSDGRKTHSCGEHLWQVSNRKWSDDRVLSTLDVIELLEKPSMENRLYIPTFGGEFGGVELPINPYALGALLGNGYFNDGTTMFSSSDMPTLDELKKSLPGVQFVFGGKYDFRLNGPKGQELKDQLEKLGLAGKLSYEKFIPEIYFKADRPSRLALFQGLMDTDGWVEGKSSAKFGTTSKQLANDVRRLAQSLGYVARETQEATKFFTHNGEKRQGRLFYQMVISSHDRKEFFRLARKQDRCSDRSPRVNFKTITKSGVEECVCISVSHPSRLYITDDYIVTHNTTLAMNIAVNIAREHHVLFLSQEMRRRDLHDRNIARVSKVPLNWLLRPQHEKNEQSREWRSVLEATKIISKLKLHIDDQPALTPMDVRLKARAVKRKYGLDVLVIDYLQLMRGSNVGKNDNRNNEVESIMRSLKALAMEMDIPIILLSQLNRSLESRPNKRPMPSDFRDSGSVEQDCSIALMLYRDEVYNENSPDKGICEVNVALNRQGKTGTIGMQFNGATSSFSDLAHGTLFGLSREAEEEKHKPKYSSRDRTR